MKIVDPYWKNINFADYISMQYRQKNKNNGNEETEREHYRRLNQERIQREENEIENEKWGRNGNMNMSRTRNNSRQDSNSIIVPVPMKYIVTDGIKHYHKTESIEKCRERLNQVKLGCNDRPKGLTYDILMKAYERKGRPFYDL